MSSFSIQEAQDLTAFGTQTVARLAEASAYVASAHDQASDERGWLTIAIQRVTDALEGVQRALLDAASLAAERLELALRQARSLSEAAFAATPARISELGLDAKPKRRAARAEAAKLAPS